MVAREILLCAGVAYNRPYTPPSVTKCGKRFEMCGLVAQLVRVRA